jgi:hypothetical protein
MTLKSTMRVQPIDRQVLRQIVERHSSLHSDDYDPGFHGIEDAKAAVEKHNRELKILRPKIGRLQKR